ncbi:hypothetical protein SRABI106_00342 [Rahnella aquatilis]|nr:hypothetical protein SRABI106_00342 [Rahnella aquatilis]
MHAEQRRFVMFFNKTRRSNVRHDHALFDQFVGIVTYGRFDTLDTTLSIEDKFRFFGFERDTATFCTRLIQHFVHGVQFKQMLNQRRILLAQFRIAFDDAPDFVVCQTRVRAHHGFVEFRAGQFALRGDSHLTDHTQAVYLWVQRTQAIRQHFRQHRHNL